MTLDLPKLSEIHIWLIALYIFFVVHTNYSVNFITGALQVSEVVDLDKKFWF